jgi:hypothetical protein
MEQEEMVVVENHSKHLVVLNNGHALVVGSNKLPKAMMDAASEHPLVAKMLKSGELKIKE